MGGQGTSYCSVCGEKADEAVSLPSLGTVCLDCLLGGRFLGTGRGLRLAAAAEKVVDLSPLAGSLVAAAVGAAEEQARLRNFDKARLMFIEQARIFRGQERPLLAAALLQRALRLPGQSGEVYLELALAALDMNCLAEAVQYFKTSSWLALKGGREDLLQKALAYLDELCPQDRWAERARGRMASRELAPEKRCRFCGRDSSQGVELVVQNGSAACQDCLSRLEKLAARECR